ncbi:hypothetical protein GCM10027440_00670 [Nocardiopsis coralliicola]
MRPEYALRALRAKSHEVHCFTECIDSLRARLHRVHGFLRPLGRKPGDRNARDKPAAPPPPAVVHRAIRTVFASAEGGRKSPSLLPQNDPLFPTGLLECPPLSRSGREGTP